MRKESARINKDEMRPEYDLSKLKGGVRGKYYKWAKAATNLVLIEPDLAEVFPGEESVNRALRLLLSAANAGQAASGRRPVTRLKRSSKTVLRKSHGQGRDSCWERTCTQYGRFYGGPFRSVRRVSAHGLAPRRVGSQTRRSGARKSGWIELGRCGKPDSKSLQEVKDVVKEAVVSDRISIDPLVCHGQACVRGTRIPVRQLVQMLGNGDTVEDLLREYPTLVRDDILACLDYAASLG